MSRSEHLGGEPGLRQVVLVEVDAEHAARAAPLHLDRIEAAIAADIEHALAGEIGRERVGEACPFDAGVIAQEMLRRRLHAVEVDVVEPGPSSATRRRISSGSKRARLMLVPASLAV